MPCDLQLLSVGFIVVWRRGSPMAGSLAGSECCVRST
jgi:hypothetical protein